VTQIKICGLTDIETALAAAQADADLLGMVFAPSKRQVQSKMARQITSVIHQSGVKIQVVGVFVNLPSSEVNRVAEYCSLDWVQLSGDETWQYCNEIERPFIKVVHADDGAIEILSSVKTGQEVLAEKQHIILLDAPAKGAYGGTGETFNWQLAAEVSKKYPVMIAGGLTASNVTRLIKEVKPWGVDVSSGVETEGRKDISKIKEFIRKVRETINN
jgi:phosphoribosylanthranilate isomerase